MRKVGSLHFTSLQFTSLHFTFVASTSTSPSPFYGSTMAMAKALPIGEVRDARIFVPQRTHSYVIWIVNLRTYSYVTVLVSVVYVRIIDIPRPT